MKRRMRVALWLYPAKWRARYEREFAALLEDAGSGWREFWDVAGGGLKMRLKWNFATVTAAVALLGAAVAAGWSWSVPETYVSTAVLRAENANPEVLQALQTKVFSRGSLAEIVAAEDLYPKERQAKPMEAVIAEMRNRDVRVQPMAVRWGDPLAFRVSFRYPDKARAQAVVRRIGAQFAAAGAKIEVLDAASLPDRPANPNRLRITVFGALAGLSVSLLLFGIRRWPLVAATGVASAAAALAIAFAISDRWISTAILFIQPTTPGVVQAVLDDAALEKIVLHKSLNLYAKQRTKQSMADVLRLMRERDLRITQVYSENRPAIAISFQGSDRYQTQAVVRMLVTAVLEARSNAPQANVIILAPAYLPEQPASPNRLQILLLGLALGVGGGVVWTVRRRPRTAAAAA